MHISLFNIYFYKNKRSKLCFEDLLAVVNVIYFLYGGSISNKNWYKRHNAWDWGKCDCDIIVVNIDSTSYISPCLCWPNFQGVFYEQM